MTAGKEHVKKMKHRKSYRNVWHTDLMNTIAGDTPYCCFALFCGPCASYKLRKQALYGDMSRYRCCGGYMPCSGKCGERKCPQFCLCTEVFFCFGNSVASTRFMLQDELNIQTTKCDNCIIGCMVCLQQVACIFSILACLIGSEELNDASQLLNCLADLVFCSVCTCMQIQHKIEMDKRDGKFGMRPMEIPHVQEMSRYDQAAYPSPPVQYGPPPYGYPPAAYPPQYQGYPPQQGYAPQQGYPPQQGYGPQQGYPPMYGPPQQGYPPQPGYPHAAYPPSHQGYPPAAYPSQPPPPPPPHVQGYPPPGQYN